MNNSSTKRINIYFITIVITLGGLLFGYDTGVINGTQFYFSKYFELTGALKGFIVSSALLGALAGAAFSGLLSKNIGRKNSLLFQPYCLRSPLGVPVCQAYYPNQQL